MVIILKDNADPRQLEALKKWVETQNVHVHQSQGSHQTILGLVGDTVHIDIDMIKQLEIVEDVRRIQEPFKSANRKFHPMDTVIDVSGHLVGDGNLCVIAGPCSIESETQIMTVARSVKKSGASMLRGGAFKPRTSPYSFQGMRDEGIKLLLQAGKETGLPVVTEVMDISQLNLFTEVDVIQVGARNMQNFELLKELGHCDKPILLKRGLCATFQELLMSAEYILANGNDKVILCERGIRTFEDYTRNTLDISMIPAMKELSHLPVIIDPSHAAGMARFVAPLSRAAVAAGTDGLIIEVHNDPARARCDGPQSLTMEALDSLMKELTRFHELAKECKMR